VGHYHDSQERVRDEYGRLRAAAPDVASAYAALHRSAMAPGALPAKTKELIALAIAITRQCEGCITAHARAAARRGATAQEVAETAAVCILMNGGPGTVYGPMALAAFDELGTDADGGS